MKPTSEDFEPRRDGWYEHRGTWGEVVVGTVLATKKRSERWEVINVSMGAPGSHIEYGHTLWFRVREQTTGVEHTIPPKNKTFSTTILTRDPRDTKTGEVVAPSDTDAIMLLAKELGAEVMATRDNETGEVTCPDYTYRSHLEPAPGHILRGLIEHMRFAHQMVVDDDLPLESAITTHGQAHKPEWPNIGKGGFPHRHVPEDLSMFGNN